jgi:hypothetical protein
MKAQIQAHPTKRCPIPQIGMEAVTKPLLRARPDETGLSVPAQEPKRSFETPLQNPYSVFLVP